MRFNKKAILGGFLSMFIATIVIILILVLFAFVSSFVKQSDGVKIEYSSDVGVNSDFYSIEFKDFVEGRVNFYENKSFGGAIAK